MNIKAERQGNEGRKQWNARLQSAADAQQMLAGAIRTIDRLLDALDPPKKPIDTHRDRLITLDDED